MVCYCAVHCEVLRKDNSKLNTNLFPFRILHKSTDFTYSLDEERDIDILYIRLIDSVEFKQTDTSP